MKHINTILLSVITLCCACITCNTYRPIHFTKQSYAMRQLQFEKERTEMEYIKAMDIYIRSVAPSSALSANELYGACKKAHIDPVFVLAQGHIESHFGTEGRASWSHSVWNVGAYDSGKTVCTYKNANESIKPYLKLLKKNYLVNGKTEHDLMTKYVNTQGKRYASSEKYERDLTYTYHNILKNTKLDSLAKQLNYFEQII